MSLCSWLVVVSGLLLSFLCFLLTCPAAIGSVAPDGGAQPTNILPRLYPDARRGPGAIVSGKACPRVASILRCYTTRIAVGISNCSPFSVAPCHLERPVPSRAWRVDSMRTASLPRHCWLFVYLYGLRANDLSFFFSLETVTSLHCSRDAVLHIHVHVFCTSIRYVNAHLVLDALEK